MNLPDVPTADLSGLPNCLRDRWKVGSDLRRMSRQMHDQVFTSQVSWHHCLSTGMLVTDGQVFFPSDGVALDPSVRNRPLHLISPAQWAQRLCPLRCRRLLHLLLATTYVRFHFWDHVCGSHCFQEYPEAPHRSAHISWPTCAFDAMCPVYRLQELNLARHSKWLRLKPFWLKVPAAAV